MQMITESAEFQQLGILGAFDNAYADHIAHIVNLELHPSSSTYSAERSTIISILLQAHFPFNHGAIQQAVQTADEDGRSLRYDRDIRLIRSQVVPLNS